MPQLDFRDKALNHILNNDKLSIVPFSKTMTNQAVGVASCLFQMNGLPNTGAYSGTNLVSYIVAQPITPKLANTLIPHFKKLYVSKLEAYSSTANHSGLLMLGDLLATYKGINANAVGPHDLSTLGSAAGSSVLSRYSDGYGVKMFADVTLAVGPTPVTLTITYTNELGVSGRTATATTIASSPIGRTFTVNKSDTFSIQLQSGDKGAD